MNNAATAGVALRRGFTGPSYTVGSACAAGSHAIGNALMLLRAGAVDAVVTGGSEAALTPLARAAFGRLEALSPTGISRPFDARRDGFVMGEGAGVLVLETAEGAEARGARALATVRGFGSTSDAHHITAPKPDGTGAAAAIRVALADAGATPSDVDYVNAHGTSTPLNDRAETLAIEDALGDRATEIPVSSTKSAIGHLLGAAGAVEAVATVLALRDRVAPPTLGFEQREAGLDLDYVPGRARPLSIAADHKPLAISNSFGFGGHNAVLCLQAA
jgi:3-oxoacyl-[acyl-carrier-protein] synthase II